MMIKVVWEDKSALFEKGTNLGEALKAMGVRKEGRAPLLAVVDGRLRESFYPLTRDCEVRPIWWDEPEGRLCYLRTASMVLFKAVKEAGGGKVLLKDEVAQGLYFSSPERPIGPELLLRIDEKMRSLIARKIPIRKRTVHMDEAMEIFEEQGMEERIRLLGYRRVSAVNLYSIEDYDDYFYGFLAPHTGHVGEFLLRPLEDGFLLSLPGLGLPIPYEGVPLPLPSGRLWETMRQERAYEEMLSLGSIGDLNDRICRQDPDKLILVSEAAFEEKVSKVAEQVCEREGVRFCMIAGPSSSGKTSFSHRLSIQLAARGKRPHPLALDNYFVNREDTPLDEFGHRDYECLEAIDVEQLNKDMARLMAGEEVMLPSFNFVTGRREYKGDTLRLEPEDILVVEGIHGLNDALTFSIPRESQFRIYICPMTTLAVDEHNRMAPFDDRLLRRLVRDARTRGNSAKETLSRWASVRRGEEKYIFPFLEKADVIVNTSLVYELAVLKVYAQPLLYQIQRGDEQYIEANRLLKLLDYFLPLSEDAIPQNSVLREFVGGSCFRV